MSLARKLARAQARKALDGIGDASKMLANLGQMKNLTEVLQAVKQLGPILQEVHGLCVGIAQERTQAERAERRERAVLLGLIAHLTKTDAATVSAAYEQIASQWDEQNPLPAATMTDP